MSNTYDLWIDGKLTVVPYTTEELKVIEAEQTAWANAAPARALEELRRKRNRLLADTDYLALSDSTLTDNMKTYRQQLRDLTTGLDTVEKIDAVVWPTKPGA